MASNPATKPLNANQGRALLRLARQAIAQRFEPPSSGREAADDGSAPPDDLADQRGGSFVTLTVAGALRGCIGSFRTDEPLVLGVRKNAVNAAFGDPRFPALTREEFGRTHIEVSVLSPPEPLVFERPEALPEKLVPGQDGVILRRGSCQATFLPQVWKQLPDPELFLAHLCLKAGLKATAWKTETIEVETYRVQSFEEEDDPAGS